MVPLSAQMIGLRFTAVAVAAGLERRVTAHSGRVGLASELTSRGASTTDVMLAGNWKTSRMVGIIGRDSRRPDAPTKGTILHGNGADNPVAPGSKKERGGTKNGPASLGVKLDESRSLI